MTGAVSAVLEWLTGGSALAALGKMALAVCGLVLALVYRRYLGILGADRRKPAERHAYIRLRNNLVKGNSAARLYAETLTRFLDGVDRFFGDAGMADRTLFPRAFGLRTPAPLWTASAFDRCLLLALIYPIATIFAIWAISGHVGPAEAALKFAPSMPGWRRGLLVALLVTSLVATVAFLRSLSRMAVHKWLAWITLLAVSLTGPVIFAATAAVIGGALTGVFALVVVEVVVLVIVVPSAVAGAAAVAGAVALLVCDATTVVSAIAILSVIVIVIGVVVASVWASTTATTRGWQGPFLSFFVLMMIAACLMAARLLSPLHVWGDNGPLLLFLGLLTLLNAPFDWVSLGLTRALLRRGLELGGWWPYLLAVADAGLAAVIIATLALTMVVGVQAFDALAVHGGGHPVLPLDGLLDGIGANPSAPEYWWLYALLLSTMIPSLVNLVIGGTSLVRGLPGLPSLLLGKIPATGNVPKFDRAWIATVLTAQVAAGAVLGIAAQVFLVVVIIGYVMPLFGLELLDMSRDVADFNLPVQVRHLLGASL